MRLIDIMKKFTDTLPPEDVDLIICNITDDPDNREFERARFFKKGSLLKHEYRSSGKDAIERLLDCLVNEPTAWEQAPETGYYILIYCPKEERMKWHLCRIKPLDSLYVILDPADIPA